MRSKRCHLCHPLLGLLQNNGLLLVHFSLGSISALLKTPVIKIILSSHSITSPRSAPELYFYEVHLTEQPVEWRFLCAPVLRQGGFWERACMCPGVTVPLPSEHAELRQGSGGLTCVCQQPGTCFVCPPAELHGLFTPEQAQRVDFLRDRTDPKTDGIS